MLSLITETSKMFQEIGKIIEEAKASEVEELAEASGDDAGEAASVTSA